MIEPLTIRALIAAYRSDPDSKYCKSEDDGGLRYVTKGNYDSLMRRLDADCGGLVIGEITARVMLRLHEKWLLSGVDMAHSLVGMLRGLITFGATLLESPECRAAKVLLHDMRFKMGKRRKVYLTVEQAEAIRTQAHAIVLPSLAIAQAFQFELAFRQKDIIGEWEPESVSRVASDVLSRGMKWRRGIRWEYIDASLILRHVTSKKQKDAEHDLRLAPMVIEELERAYPGLVISDAVFDEAGELVTEMVVDRSKLPARGPIIVHEETGWPYAAHTFRRAWRAIATSVDIPKNVQNRDSRSGKATEATSYGKLEDAQHLLGHSDLATTQIYAREHAKKAARAMRACVVGRQRAAAKKPKMIPHFAPAEAAGR